MVLRLRTGHGGYGSAADNWVYCGTGHDHLRAMGLKLNISVKTTGYPVTLDALEPVRMFRIFHCNAVSGNVLRCNVFSESPDKLKI